MLDAKVLQSFAQLIYIYYIMARRCRVDSLGAAQRILMLEEVSAEVGGKGKGFFRLERRLGNVNIKRERGVFGRFMGRWGVFVIRLMGTELYTSDIQCMFLFQILIWLSVELCSVTW